MGDQLRGSNVRQPSHLTKPVQQFLFVDADQQKASRQGRRNARSFVMQKARKERLWSTSKQAAKHKAQGRTIFESGAGPSQPFSGPSTATSSSFVTRTRGGYVSTAKQNVRRMFEQNICLVCGSLLCQPNGQTHCLICRPVPARDPNSTLYDPFQASSVPLNGSVLNLLRHCKSVLHQAIPTNQVHRAGTRNQCYLTVA
jgi:hypothetical protein